MNEEGVKLTMKFLSTVEAKAGRLRRLALCSACAVALLPLGGCADANKPIVGMITITNPSGVAQCANVSLQAGGSICLTVDVTDDPEALGVDWTVTCSSLLPEGSLPSGTVDTSCGSFTPTHTMSGPIPSYNNNGAGIVTQFAAPAKIPRAGTVTIIAHATALPSSTSSLTLTVM